MLGILLWLLQHPFQRYPNMYTIAIYVGNLSLATASIATLHSSTYYLKGQHIHKKAIIRFCNSTRFQSHHCIIVANIVAHSLPFVSCIILVVIITLVVFYDCLAALLARLN